MNALRLHLTATPDGKVSFRLPDDFGRHVEVIVLCDNSAPTADNALLALQLTSGFVRRVVNNSSEER